MIFNTTSAISKERNRKGVKTKKDKRRILKKKEPFRNRDFLSSKRKI